MRTTTIGWTLISGLAALALGACSGEAGDPSPADVPQGTASAALAEPPQGANVRSGRHDPAKMIQRFDKNGDGTLQISELPERMQAFLGKADTDKDGALSVAELTAARAKFAGHRGEFGKKLDPASMVKRFDANGDGTLQVSELPARMQKFMSKADANGDGTLSIEEMTAARDNFVKARFTRADKNGDGALTADEIGGRKWARVSVADADNSGSVSLPEMQAAIAAGKIHFGHRHHHHHRGGDGSAPSDTTTPAPVKS